MVLATLGENIPTTITAANSESGFAGAIPGSTSNPSCAYSQIT